MKRAALPQGVWALGLVSLFMDVSSEMIHALLPVFVVGTLGAGAIWLGVIEGVAEATASIVKIFSGALSDRWGKRKALALLGYGLAAITKPLFPLAGSAVTVFAARLIDRVGKGIRGAPRDALIADYTTPDQRGEAYGLRQSLDTVGAFLGPLLAIGLLLLLANNVRAVFWIAVIPAFISVAILWLAVKEPSHLQPLQKRVIDLRPRDLPKTFWTVAVRRDVLHARALLRSVSDSARRGCGIVDRMDAVGVGGDERRVYVFRLSSRRAGRSPAATSAADGRWRRARDFQSHPGRPRTTPALTLIGTALWGLHMGLTEGIFAAMVADAAPAELRGTAFGVFNLLRGVLLLFASVIAGLLWDQVGPAATFVTAAVLATLSMLLLMVQNSTPTARRSMLGP